MITDVLIALAVLNLTVSIAVASSGWYSRRQKLLQIVLIWVLPVIGGVLFGLFLLSQRDNRPPSRYPAENEEDAGKIWEALHPPDEKH